MLSNVNNTFQIFIDRGKNPESLEMQHTFKYHLSQRSSLKRNLEVFQIKGNETQLIKSGERSKNDA